MEKYIVPHCPFCEAEFIRNDLTDNIRFEEMEVNNQVVKILWCTHCGKTISTFWDKTPTNRLE